MNELMLMDENKMGALMRFAEQMSLGTVTLPDHLRGKPGDCLAISMQAAQWGMNPFAVAQKTHIVSGKLGYEAQLVMAVAKASGAIRGSFRFEHRPGIGKDDFECRAGAALAGESEITWGEWLASSQVTTKNSPLWKTNPRQQMAYLQAKNWMRLYAPEAILGVCSDDELMDSPAIKPAPSEPRQPVKMGDVVEIITTEQQALLGHLGEVLEKQTTDAAARDFWVSERDNFPKNSSAYTAFKDAVVLRRENIAKQQVETNGGDQ